LPGEQSLNVDGGWAKGNSSNNTQCKTNSLADWQLKLLLPLLLWLWFIPPSASATWVRTVSAMI
jgi:hypothetical protein